MTETLRTEVVGTVPAALYRSTFASDAPEPAGGGRLPAGWEGLYFAFDAPLADLRPDGSPAGDAVMPDFGLPRRMYAGEDTEFLRPIRFGDEVEQLTRLGAVTEKTGRSGRLVFADLVREYRVNGELAVVSTWHDVFLEAAPAAASSRGSSSAAPAEPAAAPGPEWWSDSITPDARQLFRYSALTFNTHRVHYDLAWARDVEHLDGLLVHGPLVRMLALDAVLRRCVGRVPSSYAFRVRSPLLVDRELTILGREVDGGPTEVIVLDSNGREAAEATVSWGATEAARPATGRP